MDNWIIKQQIDFMRPTIQPSKPDVLMLPGDNLAHTWQVACLKNNIPVDLSGMTVTAYFLRTDGNAVMVTGEASGNIASVTLTQECYAFAGGLRGVMRITDPETEAVVSMAEHAFVVRPAVDAGGIIDPGEVIPSIDELIAKIDEMEEATAAAEAAATKSVRYDSAQTLTDAQKEQARGNIDAVSEDDVNDLKSALAFTLLSDYTKDAGTLGANGTWANVTTTTYKHSVLDVKPGDVVSITTQTTNYCRVGFLKTYTVPTSNSDIVNYSTETGFTTRILINASTTSKFTVPADAHYLSLDVLENSINRTPVSCVVNGVDYCNGLFDNVQDAIGTVEKKASWNDLGVKSIDAYDTAYGLITSNGVWGSISAAYKHVAIPVNGGDKINITGSANNAAYIAFLKTYSIPVNGASVDFSSAYTSRITVAADSFQQYTIPSDAHYLYYLVLNNSNDVSPVSLTINGYNIANRLDKNIGDLTSNIVTRDMLEIDNISRYRPTTGLINTSNKWGNITDTNYQFVIINVQPGDIVRAVWNGTNTYIAFLKTYTGTTSGAAPDFSAATGYTGRIAVNAQTTEPFIVPSDTHYLYVCVVYNGRDSTPAFIKVNGYDIAKSLAGNINNAPGVNWCAMGDSITEGFVSYLDDGTPTYAVIKSAAWAYKVANKNNWNLTNLGIGGTGWNKPTNDQEQQGTDTTSAHYVATHTDFSPYNLVTLSYGINDWKSNNANIPIGSIDDPYDPDATPTTVVAGMRKTINAIISSNPHCKIIVILPLNCAGYQFNYGSIETNWGLGYATTNHGTLEAFVQTMIAVCNYYGVQYIDMAHYSCINRYNLLDSLTDGVHPNAETHDLLARELSKKITY